MVEAVSARRKQGPSFWDSVEGSELEISSSKEGKTVTLFK